jgi:rhodanese-related sulfurtransferase
MVLHCAISPAQTIQKVSAAEAHDLLAKTNTDSLLIIDGRSDEMFQSGYIKNAINIDAYKENLEEKLALVINRKHLFIYCTKSNRADTIINTLSRMSYKGDIILMSDGITGWKEHEFELIIPETYKKEEDGS